MRAEKILTARTADKYDLYQKSVQDAQADARWLARRFPGFTGRPLRFLREDFCGTAQILCEFVKLHGDHSGMGIDLDEAPLEWCRKNNFAHLDTDQKRRVYLIQNDVKQVRDPKADAVVVFNFSYAIFQTRDSLLNYFKTVYTALKPDGIFFLDALGGKEVPEVESVSWRVGRFSYIWDVTEFDPITNRMVCKIHFIFKDGSRMMNAFVYDWRLWSLPELREILTEAGFGKIHVLWECTSRKSNLGNGVMREVTRGIYQNAWYAILVAKK